MSKQIIDAAKEDLVWEAGRLGFSGVKGQRVAIVGDSKSEAEFEDIKRKQVGTHFEYFKKIEGKRVLIGCTHDGVAE